MSGTNSSTSGVIRCMSVMIGLRDVINEKSNSISGIINSMNVKVIK